jgi:hypothetical protein
MSFVVGKKNISHMSPFQGLGQSLLFYYNSGSPSDLKRPKAPAFAFSG